MTSARPDAPAKLRALRRLADDEPGASEIRNGDSNHLLRHGLVDVYQPGTHGKRQETGVTDPMWPVLAETEREQWEATPLVGVEPLLFGMTRGQVTAALGDRPTARSGDFASYWRHGRSAAGYMVTAYFRPAAALGGALLGTPLRRVAVSRVASIGVVPPRLTSCRGGLPYAAVPRHATGGCIRRGTAFRAATEPRGTPPSGGAGHHHVQ